MIGVNHNILLGYAEAKSAVGGGLEPPERECPCMVSCRLVLVWSFALLTAATPLAPALAAGEATAVVTDFGNRMLQVLNDPLSPAERQKRLGALLDQDFDFVKIGRFVFGRYWQSATDQEKREFAPVFRDYVAQSYSGLFNEFTGASSPAPPSR
jgi:phospholipid transport system substrate-binding protein